MAKSKHRTPSSARQSSPSFLSSLSPTTRDLLCVGLLYLVTLILFRAIVFENAAFSSETDTANAVALAKVGDEIKEKEGVDPTWMPGLFSGMPTFGNVHYVPHDVSYLQKVVVAVLKVLYLNSYWGWFPVFYLLSGVFMFLLMRVWKFSRPAALLAAITFMLSPYAIGLAGEGHGSKLMALTYLPLVFLLTYTLFERRDLLSFGLLSAGIGTLLLTNHMQIVYYVFMTLGLYLLYQVVADVKTTPLLVGKKVALFIGALAIGLCISSYIYLSVYEYSTFSIRGGGTAGSTGGLTYDYATAWSWSPWEIITLFIPSFFGFQLPYYWGPIQPWTNSTVYVGLLPVVLSIVALVYRRNRTTVFFALLTLIVLLISFGRNFSLFYEFLFNVLPFFNKFRAPAMILHLLAFTLAILGGYGLSFLMESREKSESVNVDKLRKAILYTMAVVGGLLVIGVLFKSTIYETLSGSMFLKEGEAQRYQQEYGARAPQIISQLKQARFDLLWKDYMKFAVMALAIGGIMIAYFNKKIQAGLFSGALLAVLLVDLMTIDAKLISPKPHKAIEEGFRMDATVSYLKQQPGLFRVFPIGELFMSNNFAYHGLQSIGGYSPAKLKIYQTMIDSCLYSGPSPDFPLNMNIINMLNVKYLVAKGRLPEDRFQLVNVDETGKTLTYANPGALPRAFFVGKASVAGNDSEVFAALNSAAFNPARTAVLFKSPPQEIQAPESSHVEITEYKSNAITTKAYTSSTALLVLGEVYYPAGWRAFIDGMDAEIYRTNYILRSVVVPAGEHEIRFTFEPTYYRAGWMLTNAAWGVVALCILIGLWRDPAFRERLKRWRGEHAEG
jgi:hypothetical protein